MGNRKNPLEDLWELERELGIKHYDNDDYRTFLNMFVGVTSGVLDGNKDWDKIMKYLREALLLEIERREKNEREHLGSS